MNLLNGCKTYIGVLLMVGAHVLSALAVLDPVTANVAFSAGMGLAGVGIAHKLEKLRPKEGQ